MGSVFPIKLNTCFSVVMLVNEFIQPFSSLVHFSEGLLPHEPCVQLAENESSTSVRREEEWFGGGSKTC